MDSMKVYRGMDIGTDKPPAALVDELGWGLLDLVGHDEIYSAGRWVEDAVRETSLSHQPVLFAGGTPLYLRLLLQGMFPGPPPDVGLREEFEQLWKEQGEAHFRALLAEVDPVLEARLFPGDKKRLMRGLEVHRLTGRPLSDWQKEETRRPIEGRFQAVALRHQAEAHQDRVRERVSAMFQGGLLEEVETLRARADFAPEAGRSIGYAEAMALLDGSMSREDAEERVMIRTRQLVRRQRIFLASFPDLRWVDVAPGEAQESVVDRVQAALG